MLQGDVVRVCRSLAPNHPWPCIIYSHISGNVAGHDPRRGGCRGHTRCPGLLIHRRLGAAPSTTPYVFFPGLETGPSRTLPHLACHLQHPRHSCWHPCRGPQATLSPAPRGVRERGPTSPDHMGRPPDHSLPASGCPCSPPTATRAPFVSKRHKGTMTSSPPRKMLSSKCTTIAS